MVRPDAHGLALHLRLDAVVIAPVCTARNEHGELCTYEGLHAHCASCGVWIADTFALCPHHTYGVDDWAVVNRLANDALMRGRWPVFESGDPLPTEGAEEVATADVAW